MHATQNLDPEHMISKERFWQWLAAATLIIGLLFQAYFWAHEFGNSFPRNYATLGQSAVWRSANFSQSQKFADYVVFLLRSIPRDMRVILPPQGEGPQILGTTPMMQYFLMPRPVINCQSPNCLADLSLENSAVLLIGDFPGPAGESLLPKKLMFDNRWGVLLPPGVSPADGRGDSPSQPDSLLSLGAQALLPAIWLALLAQAGRLLLRRFLTPSGLAFELSLGYGLGMGLLTFTLAVLSMLGIRLSSLLVMVTSAVLILVGFGAAIAFSHPRPNLKLTMIPRPDPWLAGLLLLALAAAFLSVGMGYRASDELLIWGPKALGIAHDQSIAGVMNWGTNTVHYPLHIPLLGAAFKLVFDETLPASKLAFSGYFAAVLVFIYKLLQENGLRRPYAACAAAFFGLTPLIFRHATLAYANLPLAYALLAAVLLYQRGARTPAGFPASAGIFLAIAAWTRPEGAVMAWSALGTMVLIQWITERALPARSTLLAAIAPLAIFAVIWQQLQIIAYPRPASQSLLLPQAVNQLRTGVLHLADLSYILRSMAEGVLDFSTWGLMGTGLMVTIGLAVLLAIIKPGSNRSIMPMGDLLLLVTGALFLVLLTAVYYLVSYDSSHDIDWWVNTGLDRMLLPAVLLLYSGGTSWIGKLLDHRENRAAPGNP